MTSTKKPFSVQELAATKAPAKKRATPKGEVFPKMSPWAKEFMKRVDKLHKAMDGKKLA